ncbi:mitogen-activated protein kinase kinase kinase NPK1-like isoform X1 [Iris pallida]|uniref:mitogen-activated protein kinase kinase kinase n=1 Tax=Iris pallida TaxID=29817 RepID=A0AAX6DLD6_IRIPA|nr:mitogen-activated protein kinase kinase kinase NPK1-like isoform X1 [Iris pallida]
MTLRSSKSRKRSDLASENRGSDWVRVRVPPAATLPSPDRRGEHPFGPVEEGELVGCGAFGHVYMGMNLDSEELLAVKQVLTGANNVSKEKAQAHIRELEEEVNLLKSIEMGNLVQVARRCFRSRCSRARHRARRRGVGLTLFYGVV